MQLLKSNVTAQPRETPHYTLVRWGGGLHLEWRARRSSALSQDDHRAEGLACASQAVADPALEAQGSTGSQDFKSGKEVGGRTFPNPSNEISTVMLIWVANTCKLATVRFLSVEKCGEGEEGEAGRTQGS